MENRTERPRASSRQHLAELLEGRLEHLSPALQRVAEHVLRNYQDVAFMGVAELSRAAGVSPAAVVRFATSLDFTGYPELQRTLQMIVRSELRQSDRFIASLEPSTDSTPSEQVLTEELQNLAKLRTLLDRAGLDGAVQDVLAARRVAVVGFRASATLAHYLWYNLRKVKSGVELMTSPGSVALDDLALGDEATLTVFLTFPRYSRELIELAEFAREQPGCGRSLGITNNELSPLVPLCDRALLVEVREVSFTDFYAAPIALLNILVAEVARAMQDTALTRLKRLDDLAAARGYLHPIRRRGEV